MFFLLLFSPKEALLTTDFLLELRSTSAAIYVTTATMPKFAFISRSMPRGWAFLLAIEIQGVRHIGKGGKRNYADPSRRAKLYLERRIGNSKLTKKKSKRWAARWTSVFCLHIQNYSQGGGVGNGKGEGWALCMYQIRMVRVERTQLFGCPIVRVLLCRVDRGWNRVLLRLPVVAEVYALRLGWWDVCLQADRLCSRDWSWIDPVPCLPWDGIVACWTEVDSRTWPASPWCHRWRIAAFCVETGPGKKPLE